MKFGRHLVIAATCILLISALLGCSQSKIDVREIATVTRGNIQASPVTADGNLSMPRQFNLSFGVSGTVEDVKTAKSAYDKDTWVFPGTMLARLDGSDQQLALTNAVYDVEIALNALAEKVYPSLLGYPNYYPSVTSRLRVEQARKALSQAIVLSAQKDYAAVAAKLRLISHDLKSGMQTLQEAETYINNYPEKVKDNLGDPENWLQYYPAIHEGKLSMEKSLKSVLEIQKLVENASYQGAAMAMDSFKVQLDETYRVVDNACGSLLQIGISYPDASTSLTVMQDVKDTMLQMKEIMAQGNAGSYEFAEKMELAMSDLDVSQNILEDNELLLKTGINMQQLRQYNLNYQKARTALKKARQDLLKTEILVPNTKPDDPIYSSARNGGKVYELNIKEGDQLDPLSAYNYVSKIPIRFVNTDIVEFTGNIDEVDIFKVKLGQKVNIKADALPGKTINGVVKSVSPVSSQVAGVVNYPVTIALEPTRGLDLKGGLTATADIIIQNTENVLVLPLNAVKGTGSDRYVELVVDKTNWIFERRKVTTGAQNSSLIEITSGLKEGDQVFINGTAAK